MPLQSVLTQGSVSGTVFSENSDPRFYDWLLECHGFWHNALLIFASFLFVLYLAIQAKQSYVKLSHGRSHIIISYYGCLWLASVLNFFWCLFQSWECAPGKELAWNLLSLFTTSAMLFLEVSLLAFLLQGNNASGLEALTRTFGISALIVGLDLSLKAIYLFVFGIPLFVDSNDSAHHVKWNLWVVHKLFLTAVYGFILFMYHSRWRERLPARPAFYRLYSATVVCYHSFYLPLLYFTFLADFFQEEDLNLENAYYSEMKDAGFLDTDWE